MEKPTKEWKKDIDRVVMLAIEKLYIRRLELYVMYWDAPDKFSKILRKKMFEVPAMGVGVDLVQLDKHWELPLLDKSIRRLRSQKKLRIEWISIPVMSSLTNKVSKRKIACYWPSSILDELASV